MKEAPKELSLEHEIALFMLAIVLVRHEVTLSNIREQFSPLQLTNEVNSLPFGNKGNFNVDALALSHGMARFFKGIKDIVSKTPQYHSQSGSPLIAAYHSLPSIVVGMKLTFNIISSTVLLNEKETLQAIVAQRDTILSLTNCKSDHPCLLSAIGDFEYQKSLQPTKSEYNLKRQYSDLKPRQQGTWQKKVLAFFETKFAADALRVLEDALTQGKNSQEKKKRLSVSELAPVTGLLFPPNGSTNSTTNDVDEDDNPDTRKFEK
jgi:hypothetical protein